MKQHLKKLAVLLLAVALILSLAGMAEELPVSEEALDFGDVPVYEEIPEEIPEELDIADLLILDDNAQETFADESESALAQEAAGEAVSNAIPSKVTIGVKEKYTIDTSSLSGKLTFKSSKTSIATVSSKGVVTGKKVGTAKITVTPKSGKKKTITVTVAKAPTKVTLNKTKATVTVGKTLQLKATLPSKTASNKLTWTSSNKSVATVNKNGKVTAKKAGTATITVKTFNGKKATCKVTVKKASTPSSVTLSVSNKSVSIEKGSSVTVKVTYTGDDYVYWESDDDDIAFCLWEGNWDGNTRELTIYGGEAGSTTITVYNDAEDKYVTINVTVTKPVSLTSDKTSISLKAANTDTIKITYTGTDSISFNIADTNIVSCKWGDGWNNNTTELYITGKSAGSTTVTVTGKTTGLSVKINVTVTAPTPGTVSGMITYLYNYYRGNVADTGALVYLIPKDGRAKQYYNDSYISFRSSPPSNINQYGIYCGTVDGSGEYYIQRVPPGEYLIYVISKKTTAKGWFDDKSSYYSRIKTSLSWYLQSGTAQAMAEACSYNKYTISSITVYEGESTRFSYDFGITYV